MKRIAFTTLLNGMPFLQKQLDSNIKDLFDEWYFIEGAVNKTNDTVGNNVPEKYFTKDFLSIDGTTEILDSYASNKIKVVRNNGQPWNGYVSMANAISDKFENCLLMMIDVDEFWPYDRLDNLLKFAEQNMYNTYMFMCYYFVGKDKYLFENNRYGNNHYEWNRLWKIDNKVAFKRLQPPYLHEPQNIILADKNLTVQNNWIFSHYSYALEEQVRFKCDFFNKGDILLTQWKKLQQIQKDRQYYLSEFFNFESTAHTPIHFLNER